MRSPIGVGLGLLVLGGGGSIAGSQWSLVLLGVGLGMIVGSAMQAGEMSKEMAKNERGGNGAGQIVGTLVEAHASAAPLRERRVAPDDVAGGDAFRRTFEEALSVVGPFIDGIAKRLPGLPESQP